MAASRNAEQQFRASKIASAQSYSAGYGTGNVINLPALEHGGFAASSAASAAFAAASEGEQLSRIVVCAGKQRFRTIQAPYMSQVNMLAAIPIRISVSNFAVTGHTTEHAADAQ